MLYIPLRRPHLGRNQLCLSGDPLLLHPCILVNLLAYAFTSLSEANEPKIKILSCSLGLLTVPHSSRSSSYLSSTVEGVGPVENPPQFCCSLVSEASAPHPPHHGDPRKECINTLTSRCECRTEWRGRALIKRDCAAVSLTAAVGCSQSGSTASRENTTSLEEVELRGCIRTPLTLRFYAGRLQAWALLQSIPDRIDNGSRALALCTNGLPDDRGNCGRALCNAALCAHFARSSPHRRDRARRHGRFTESALLSGRTLRTRGSCLWNSENEDF